MFMLISIYGVNVDVDVFNVKVAFSFLNLALHSIVYIQTMVVTPSIVPDALASSGTDHKDACSTSLLNFGCSVRGVTF